MQARAEADLERLFTTRLKEAGLNWSALETFSGPRRIGLSIKAANYSDEDLAKERQAFDNVTAGEDLTSLGDLLDEATK
jgi:glycyl-tRNA synthetase beta subunit